MTGRDERQRHAVEAALVAVLRIQPDGADPTVVAHEQYCRIEQDWILTRRPAADDDRHDWRTRVGPAPAETTRRGLAAARAAIHREEPDRD